MSPAKKKAKKRPKKAREPNAYLVRVRGSVETTPLWVEDEAGEPAKMFDENAFELEITGTVCAVGKNEREARRNALAALHGGPPVEAWQGVTLDPVLRTSGSEVVEFTVLSVRKLDEE